MVRKFYTPNKDLISSLEGVQTVQVHSCNVKTGPSSYSMREFPSFACVVSR